MRYLLLTLLLLMLTVQTVQAQSPAPAIERHPIEIERLAGSAETNLSAPILDAGFEMGSPNPHWSESSTHFGTPICNSGCGLTAHSGEFYAWFGGVSNALEVAVLEQDVLVSAKNSPPPFFLQIGSDNGQGNLSVWLDNQQIATFSQADLASYPTYAPVSIPLNNLTAGTTYRLRFYGVTYPGGTLNFLLDDIALVTIPLAVQFNRTQAATNSQPLWLLTTALFIYTLGLIFLGDPYAKLTRYRTILCRPFLGSTAPIR